MIAAAVVLVVGGTFATYRVIFQSRSKPENENGANVAAKPAKAHAAARDPVKVQANARPVADAVQKTFTLKSHGGRVYSVAFSPDGKRLTSASADGTVKVWDAATGQELLTLKGHNGEVNSVAYSPDGQRLVSASDDHTIKVWDAVTGKEVLTLKGHNGEVNSVVFSQDGKRLASASRDATKVWDATTGHERQKLDQSITWITYSVAFSPDGKWLARACFSGFSSSGFIEVWDLGPWTWEKSREIEPFDAERYLIEKRQYSTTVSSVVYSPDGQRLAAACGDKTVKLWDATTGEGLLTLKGHTKVIRQVAFSPDGKRLASASEDGTVRVWDVTPR